MKRCFGGNKACMLSCLQHLQTCYKIINVKIPYANIWSTSYHYTVTVDNIKDSQTRVIYRCTALNLGQDAFSRFTKRQQWAISIGVDSEEADTGVYSKERRGVIIPPSGPGLRHAVPGICRNPCWWLWSAGDDKSGSIRHQFVPELMPGWRPWRIRQTTAYEINEILNEVMSANVSKPADTVAQTQMNA